jgi:hypothetical protein
VIFGTDEYKLWKAYREDFPTAKMIARKSIKKNPNKKTTKNLTYDNMRAYIKEQDNAEVKLDELEKQIRISKIQSNPYRAVLAWFEQSFTGYDSYKAYFSKLVEGETVVESAFALAAAANY